MPSEIHEVYITPLGLLKDSIGTFEQGNGFGLLSLTQLNKPQGEGIKFFHKLFTSYIQKLSTWGEPNEKKLSGIFEQSRPSSFELEAIVLSAPPFVGGEYFNETLLERFYVEFEQALQIKFSQTEQSFTNFIRGLNPIWKDVGKLSFHLAENKSDDVNTHPFAFMASFIYRATDKPKHLPLSAALRAYANDKESLSAILSPLQQVAKKSEVVRDLLDSRLIFQPAVWTSHEAYRFLQDIPLFEEANIVVRIANLWKSAPPKAKVSVALDVSKKSLFTASSLLDFSVKVSLGDERLTQSEIQEILHSSGGLVRIKGQWIEADPQKISELLNYWEKAEILSHKNGLSLADGLRLLSGTSCHDSAFSSNDNDDSLCQFEASGELKKLLNDLHNPGQIDLPPLPDKLDSILRPYQLDGVKYLWRTTALGLGACLADDMGLGKTLQMLSLIRLWKQEGTLDQLPVLLILPATLLSNWKNESAQFTPDLKITTLHPSSMSKDEIETLKKSPKNYLLPFDIALITYGMLPRMPQLSELSFPAIIADEAQAIKNPTSRQSKSVRKLQGKHKIVLTGTPVENRLTDLWSIFDFINPNLLGNLKSFISFTKNLNDDYSPLRKLTQPFILRRLKTDKRIISDLPDKTELKVYCQLTKQQAALYAKSVQSMEEALESSENGIARRGIVLAYLIRFKQICNHPAQFLGNGDYDSNISGKFLRLTELVESIASRQEKLLVFSQFREMTDPLYEHLTQCFGRSGLILHGGTPVKERAKLVKTFQEDDTKPFFVLSLKAAGTGLNLTAANHVVHFDRWWNPAVENQASDRAFRIGQKRNVLVHKFICKGTLEEKIDELIMDKQHLADSILSEGAEKLLTSMNNDELIQLVKLDINSMTI
ncbi:MAG: DEAD/DEAH box helicase [Akkermansia sp.]